MNFYQIQGFNKYISLNCTVYVTIWQRRWECESTMEWKEFVICERNVKSVQICEVSSAFLGYGMFYFYFIR